MTDFNMIQALYSKVHSKCPFVELGQCNKVNHLGVGFRMKDHGFVSPRFLSLICYHS